METEAVSIINDVGFPIFVAVLLLYDKIKTNGSLKTAVDNNTLAIAELRSHITKLK